MKKIILYVLAGFILGFLVGRFGQRPYGTGAFWVSCRGWNCEILAHVPWWAGRDVVLFQGPKIRVQINASHIQLGAPELAGVLNVMPGYGAHYREK